jgi:O-antigen/teichoic acid export membrane protein
MSSPESLRKYVLIAGSGSTLIKFLSIGVTFVTTLLLARVMSISDFGAYQFATSFTSVFALIAVIGLDKVSIRRIASYKAAGQHALIRGLIQRGQEMVLVAALALVCIALFVRVVMPLDGEMSGALAMALPLIPLLALIRVKEAVLQGFRYIVAGQITDLLVRPLLFLTGVAALWYYSDRALGADRVVVLLVLTSALSLTFAALLQRHKLASVTCVADAEYETKNWLKSAVSFAIISGVQTVNAQADILMLGVMGGPKEAGVYAVATRVSGLLSLIVFAGTVVLSPVVAGLYATGQNRRLADIVTRVTQVTFASAAVAAVPLCYFRTEILSIFGPEFLAGKMAFVVLVVARVIYTAGGFVGMVLFMTGHEKDAAVAFGVTAAVNIALNAALIPHWSMLGAAIGTGTSIVVLIVLCTYMVRRRMGIGMTIFNVFSLCPGRAK